MTDPIITPEAAQAAMNAAIAKKNAALAAFGETEGVLALAMQVARAKVAKDHDTALADAKAIRDAALKIARKAEVEANKLVRKASVAKAKAEAKRAAEGQVNDA